MPQETNEKAEDPYQAKDVTSDFYSMGSYCTIEFNSRAFNTLTLNSIYRISFDEIKRYKIPDFDPSTAQPTKNNDVHHHNDDGVLIEDEPQDPSDPNYAITKKEQRLKSLLDRTRRTMENENPLQVIEEGSFLLSKIKPVHEPDFQLDIHLEAKLKHIIDMYSKILALNKSQLPLVNYNLKDAYRILDSLGSFLASSRYFRNEELQDAFEQVDIHLRVDKIHSLIRKYFNFLEHFADLGVYYHVLQVINCIAIGSTKYKCQKSQRVL